MHEKINWKWSWWEGNVETEAPLVLWCSFKAMIESKPRYKSSDGVRDWGITSSSSLYDSVCILHKLCEKARKIIKHLIQVPNSLSHLTLNCISITILLRGIEETPKCTLRSLYKIAVLIRNVQNQSNAWTLIAKQS